MENDDKKWGDIGNLRFLVSSMEEKLNNEPEVEDRFTVTLYDKDNNIIPQPESKPGKYHIYVCGLDKDGKYTGEFVEQDDNSAKFIYAPPNAEVPKIDNVWVVTLPKKKRRMRIARKFNNLKNAAYLENIKDPYRECKHGKLIAHRAPRFIWEELYNACYRCSPRLVDLKEEDENR